MLKKIKLFLLKYNKPKTFFLKVDKEHIIYGEEYGNPNGKVFIYLHGGPGGSVDYTNLRWFNLKKHRVIIFEQRGCNRSEGEFFSESNNTNSLVEDIDKIRSYLNINKFSIFGGSWGSWGSCLALAYAIKYPDRIESMHLWGLLLGNKADTTYIPKEYLSPQEKLYCDRAFFFPYDDWIIRNCNILSTKTIYLAHGNNDLACSYMNSIKIKEVLPNIDLFIEEGGYHSSSSKGIEAFLLKSIKNS